MPNPIKAAAIILAGGTSSRMSAQRNKLLLPLHNRPILAYVLEAAYGSQARPLVLVLGHQAQQVRDAVQPMLVKDEIIVVENPAYQQGQSTSMQAGLRALLTFSHDYTKEMEAAIFLLGDQPLITSSMIDALLTQRERTGKRIVLPLYQGQRGNPVVFSLDLAPELLAVTGDEGGRGVLKRHPDDIATLEMGEVIANSDVDTWEAYCTLQAAWPQHVQEK